MKLHLPKQLFTALLTAITLAIPAQAAPNELGVVTGGHFYAGDYAFNFSISEGDLVAGSDTTDVLGLYWGSFDTGNYYSNGYTLTLNDKGEIVLYVGDGSMAYVSGGNESASITENTTFSGLRGATFTTKLEVGATYTIKNIGSAGSDNDGGYGQTVTLLKNGVAVETVEYNGNMNGGNGSTVMVSVGNAEYGASAVSLWKAAADAADTSISASANYIGAFSNLANADLVFSAEESVAKTVTLNEAGVTVKSVALYDNYTFTSAEESAAMLTVSNGLNLVADKTLTLSNVNLTLGGHSTISGTITTGGTIALAEGSTLRLNKSLSNLTSTITGSGRLEIGYNAGTLGAFSNADFKASGTLAVVSGGVVSMTSGNLNTLTNAIEVDGGQLTLTRVGNGENDIAKSITVTNGGKLVLDSTDIMSESASNTISISDSELAVGDHRIASGSGTKYIFNNARVTGSGDAHGALDFSNNATITSSGTSSIDGALRIRGGKTLTINVVDAVDVVDTVDVLTVGTIVGVNDSSSLTKTGTGTLVITSMASKQEAFIRGTTTISEGAVEYNLSTDGTYSGQVVGAGSLKKSGTGTLTLSGAIGSSAASLGSISVTGGELKLSSTSPAYIGTVSVSDGSKLNFNGVNATISGAVTNNAAIELNGGVLNIGSTITGTGTLTLDGTLNVLSSHTLTEKEGGSVTYAGGEVEGNGFRYKDFIIASGSEIIYQNGFNLQVGGVNATPVTQTSSELTVNAKDGSFHVNSRAETVSSTAANSFYVAKDATLTFSDAFTGAKTWDITGEGTLAVTIGSTDNHGNNISASGFNGVLMISKGATGNGNTDLTKYTLGADASFKLVSGNHWSQVEDGRTPTISRDIVLAGATANDFSFRHNGLLELSGKVTGTYLTSGRNSGVGGTADADNNLKLSGEDSTIDCVTMGGGTLTVAADMSFGSASVVNMTVNADSTLSVGNEQGVDSSVFQASGTVTIESGSKLNLQSHATASSNITTMSGAGAFVNKGGSTIISQLTGFSGTLEVQAGSLEVTTYNASTTLDITLASGASLNFGSVVLDPLNHQLDPEGDVSFQYGEYAQNGAFIAGDNGFKQETSQYYIFKNYEWQSGASVAEGYSITANNGHTYLTLAGVTDFSKYYVNKGSVDYSAGSGIANDTTRSIELDGGDLNMQTSLNEAATGGIIVRQDATITLATEAQLSAGALTINAGAVTLAGSGTYQVANGATGMTSGVTLGTDWTGTVVVNDATSNLTTVVNALGNEASTVQLTNANGYFNTPSNSGELEVTPNLHLVNGKNGVAAVTIVNGNSDNTPGTRKAVFTGKVSGSGDIHFKSWINNTKTATYKFTGDVSEWDGSFVVLGGEGVKSGDVNLIFSQDASEINASIVNNNPTQNKLLLEIGETGETEKLYEMNGVATVDKLTVNQSTDFNNTVSVSNTLLIASDKTATVTSSLTAANVTNNGTLKLGKVVTNGETKETQEVASISGGSMSGVTASSAGISSSATNGAKGSISGADVQIAQLAADASFTIADMTLTNTTITAATVDTKVELQNVSGDVTLKTGTFGVAMTTVGMGGSALTYADGVPSITLSSTDSGAAKVMISANPTLDVHGTYGTYSLTFNLNLQLDSSVDVPATNEAWSALVGFEGWLGTMLQEQGAIYAGEPVGQSSAPSVSYGYSAGSGGSNVGTLTIIINGLNVPEPTTSTLSLLALAGLCARRRRKND